jgi:hypothetical protein
VLLQAPVPTVRRDCSSLTCSLPGQDRLGRAVGEIIALTPAEQEVPDKQTADQVIQFLVIR